MAKQYGSYMGGFAGRLGPAVGYMWNGVWVMRSRPGRVRNPRTAAQVACREAFKAQVQLAAQMRDAVIQGLTMPSRMAHMTSYNLFVSINQPCFALDEGALAVDWEQVQLSVGPVAPVRPLTANVDSHNVLTVTFDPNHSERRSRGRDRVWTYVYCPELGKGVLAAPVYRRDKRVSLMLPDRFAGREAVVYLFVQDEMGEGSPTVGIAVGTADAAAPEPQAGPSAETLPTAAADTYAEPTTTAQATAATPPPGGD